MLINMTPHPIVLQAEDGTRTILPPEGTVPRVDNIPGQPSLVEGIPVPVWSADKPGKVTGLPQPRPGVFFIVSGFVGAATPRFDLLVPGTGPQDGAIRNEKGHIVAVTRLKRVV